MGLSPILHALTASALLVWAAVPAMGQDAKPPAAPAAAAAPAAQEPAPNPYAGSDTCKTCHEDIYNALVKSPHGAIETSSRLQRKGQACEACHGPGATHAGSADAAAIKNPAKLSPAEVDRLCLNCHLNQATPVGYLRSSHAGNQVACTSCHSVHNHLPTGLVARGNAAVNTQCSSCHLNARAQFEKPDHHKVPENAMACVDCHNPHGTTQKAMQQTASTNEPGCYKCHADKRGPFAFEHAPVRWDGCAACHEPHGSANPRMLVRAEVRFVCLECHSNLPFGNTNGTRGVTPPAFHNLNDPRYRNCTVCHQKIHGSHIDRNLLK